MRILLLAPSKSIHTQKWALFYKQNNIEVKVVTFADHYSEDNASKVDTFVLPKLLPGKLAYFSGVRALKKLIQEYKPDILHSHYVSSYGLVGALTGFKPHFVSVWGRDIFQFPLQNMLNKRLVQFTLKQAQVICSTSKVMAEETNLYTNKNVYVTPFGVDLAKFRPIPHEKEKDSLVIGTVKALSDKYGIGDLIKAFSQVTKKYPEKDLSLLIIGDGPQRKEYEGLAAKLNIEEKTVFTGKVPNDDVPNYINKMDIFAVPSTENSESFGVAAVEAMACGVPVVVSDVGGLPEVVKNGETGYVVPKESPDQLAEKFSYLIENPQLKEKIGQQAIQHVNNHYNWIDNANGMLELYNQTLKKGMRS
ncbi:glycosyltransferase [Rossellomorea aquimaris]|uniref:glycosyltransferase n=1 Tax=Rossellomorea aquimaris TaxID=189382 RepID=UPI0007D0495D|nr:glycosyltransferase [Rossellomorea aquimaris]